MPILGGENNMYIVKTGDNLWSIAQRQLGDGFLYHELVKLNHLESSIIYPGQELNIPYTK